MVEPLSFSRVSTVPDIIDQTRFLLTLGAIPGSGDTDDLSIKCFNATVPGTGTEVFQAPMHAHPRNFRGRRTHATPASFSFWEDSDMASYRKLERWLDRVADSETGNSDGYLAEYSVLASFSIFDTTGREAARWRLDEFFISDLSDVSLSAESSAGVQIQAQFTFSRKRLVI